MLAIPMKKPPIHSEIDCKREMARMLKNSQTKVIMPALAFGVLLHYIKEKNLVVTDTEVKRAYQNGVRILKDHLGHELHIGAKYEDAYGMRMSRYGFLSSLGHLRYKLASPFATHAQKIVKWLPGLIEEHINTRLGIIPSLGDAAARLKIAQNPMKFMELVSSHLDSNPSNFEIVSFAVIKVHLEKFACRIYRDTRTSSHDHGVDLATNFGVVYQVKKLRVYNRSEADRLYAELKFNFDQERLQDGNVILVIDDIAEEMRRYLIDMKIQSIKKDQLIAIAKGFEDSEDRQKVLRVIYDEFARDYSGILR
jgi:hypothetical protein